VKVLQGICTLDHGDRNAPVSYKVYAIIPQYQ